ncbi:MAG: DUF2238 domain-containing protein [Candidatus Yanofskybacteria bacterium]|nr:DUF2238 domain-containing protein [Candidatus Yanofskybacteria bacterium]
MKSAVPFLAMFAVVFVGLIPLVDFDLYAKYHNLDKYMHLLGGFVLAWLVWQIFSRRNHLEMAEVLTIIVGSVAVLGILWEIGEYVSTAFINDSSMKLLRIVHHYFAGGDVKDTLLDLTMDMTGAFLFGLGTVFSRRSTRSVQEQ